MGTQQHMDSFLEKNTGNKEKPPILLEGKDPLPPTKINNEYYLLELSRNGKPIEIQCNQRLISNGNPNILMIQETKINEQESGKMIQKIRNYEASTLQATRASGGICTLWRKGKWELVHQLKYQHWIKTDLRNKIIDEQYCMINIYAPNHYKEK